MSDLYKCEQCGKLVLKKNYYRRMIDNKLMGLCGKHYAQYSKYNKFLDCNPYSQYDPNEYEVTDEGVWIFCYNRAGDITTKFIIDEEDLDMVIKKKWRFTRGNFCTGNTKAIQIHTFLMNPEEGQVVDHINGDRSDNRRSNLRITTQQKNTINKCLMSNNTSGVAGVCWDKDRNRWTPEIKINYQKCHLGRYKQFEDAVYARYIAELALFEEYRSFRNDNTILDLVEKCQNKKDISDYVLNKLRTKHML